MQAYTVIDMFTRNLESRPEGATIGNSASCFVSIFASSIGIKSRADHTDMRDWPSNVGD